jgi:very-short-patch-repair endonuclease
VWCRSRLVIKVDGDAHIGAEARDAERDALTRAAGYRVFRVTNDEVFEDAQGVVAEIIKRLEPPPRTAVSDPQTTLALEAAGFGGGSRPAS